MQGHDFLEDCLVKCRDDYSHAILTGHNHPSEALSMEFRKKVSGFIMESRRKPFQNIT